MWVRSRARMFQLIIKNLGEPAYHKLYCCWSSDSFPKMKSDDIATHHLFPTTFTNPTPTAQCYHPLTGLPLLTQNSFWNPCLFSLFSTFPEPTLNTIPMLDSQPPFSSHPPLLKFPQLIESTPECFSQSSESSQTTESGKSTPSNSLPERISSPESCTTTSRIRRGRPQQDITDDDDPNSQKRRHRRLYARQYRAQMRHKVDEVKVLKVKLDEMRRTVEKLEAALESERREHQHKALLLNSMIQSKLIP
ncbi:hypothetical protein GCK32_010248 [Trichostrongylus colubriformis]|uniref:BZIP domain-containing protein n=1 Tax=Trichostrongylus colubriformis TaxID=6319 RepID=A0AAN8IRB1_TRICO